MAQDNDKHIHTSFAIFKFCVKYDKLMKKEVLFRIFLQDLFNVSKLTNFEKHSKNIKNIEMSDENIVSTKKQQMKQFR